MLTPAGPLRSMRASRRLRPARALLAAVFALLFGLGLAQPAMASHLQGGYFTAKVTPAGRMQGTFTFLQLRACTAGLGSQMAKSATLTNPSGTTVNQTINTVATVCNTDSSVFSGSFDWPLDTTTFPTGAPDGNYTVAWTESARIAGIVNLANSGSASVRVRAQVRKKTGVATSAPYLGSDVATGIGIGELYSQNLNASDPDDVLGNGTLTYAALTGATDLGPDSNVISIPKLTANGQIEIAPATTSGMADNAKYIYKVRVTDDQGDFAERDVLLTATTPNKPPVINGFAAGGYDIADGATQTINFTATDPDGANTVKISGAGLPSWATLTQTPGNPAQGTLTLAPPVDTNTRVYRLNFDAIDNDSKQPLTGSATVEVRLQGAPETQLLTQPDALTTSTSAAFTFAAANPAYTFECRIDSGAWEACTSPKNYTGLSDGPRTFQVRANDGTRVDPSPASFTWTVDTTPPTTTFTTKPAAATSSTTANFAWTSNETGNVTYECSLDGAAFAACTTPRTITGLADGSHTLRVRATDTLGHVEVTPASHTWVVDRTAPDSGITGGPTGLTSSDSATFTLTSTEPGSTFECKLDAGAWAACTTPRALTGLADGSHTLAVRAIDAAGNTDATPASRTWTVDTTAPGTAIDSGPAALSTATTADFTFSSADATATFECRLDGGAWAPCTTPRALTGLADGSHTFEVRAVDPAGNVDATPASRTWSVDTGTPTSAITARPAAHSDSADASFAFSSADPDATFECKLDAGAWAACTSPRALTGLSDGDHTFSVRAKDPSGNTETTPSTVTWNVDTVAPATTITSGPAALSTVDTASFVLASDDPAATFECKLDAGSWAPCTSPHGLTGLQDGDHTLEVRSTDLAGNTDASPVSYTWNVDTGAPSTTIDARPDAHSPSPDATFAFSSTDPAATFECKLDGGTWVTCPSPKVLTGLADGDHTLEVRATDPSGNVEATPATYTWNVDTTAPADPVAKLPKPGSRVNPAVVTFDPAPAGERVQCRIDGGPWTDCVSPLDLKGLPDGEHTVEVRTKDDAGNVSAGTPSSTFTVDTTAPTAPTIKQAPAAVSSQTGFEFGHEAGAKLECQVDGGAWVPCDTTYAPTLADGEHTVAVRQTDEAGNVSPAATHRWTLDRTAPEAPVVVSGPTGTTTERGANFAFTAEPGTTTECRLDGGAWTPCASPLSFGNLAVGEHVLELRSTDAAGNVSGLRTERWTVTAPGAPAPAPTKPAPTAVRVDVSRSVSIDASKATVGCALKGASVDKCEVGIYAMKSELGLAKKGSKEDKLVRIGTGTASGDGTSSRVGVKIKLNGTGQRAMKLVGGVKARVNIRVKANGGQTLAAHRYTTVRPATQLVVPSDGLFATDSAVISTVGRRYLQGISIQLRHAKRIGCVGHTDAQGSAAYNQRLGLARAKAVCAYLTALKVPVAKTATSLGERGPRATNATASGRALNRRVELDLRYR